MSNASSSPELGDMVLAETAQLRIPTNLDCIEPTVELLKNKALQCGACEETQAARLVLALHEALTNSIVHGNLEVSSKLKEENNDNFARQLAERSADPHYANRVVHIRFDYNGERCEWALTDQGNGFDYEEVLARPEPAPEELWAVSGRGILMIRALLDDVRYEAGGRRTLLTLRRSASPEKRLHPRWPMHQRVQVTPIRADGSVDWDTAYEAVTQNLSRGGLGLLQSQLIRAERVLVAMDLEGRTIYLPAQVRHCNSVQNGMLELGCRFQAADEATVGKKQDAYNLDQAIASMLGRLQWPTAQEDERRRHPRVSYTERIEVTTPANEVKFAFARDLSRGGIALITSEALAAEEHLLTLPLANDSPLRVRAQVVRCLPITEGFFHVGARFVGLA
jgi:anti-sigma regulatory factor (Ser/Thr protein kinase)